MIVDAGGGTINLVHMPKTSGKPTRDWGKYLLLKVRAIL